MNGDLRLKVYNKANYDIGVRLTNGQGLNIKPNSFQLLTVNDIFFIESICAAPRYFSAKMLVPVDDNGKELTLEDLGGYTDDFSERHMTTEEIVAMLKKPIKTLEPWLDDINSPEELHSIYMAAMTMMDTLPGTKIKLLKEKIPDKDWLNEM